MGPARKDIQRLSWPRPIFTPAVFLPEAQAFTPAVFVAEAHRLRRRFFTNLPMTRTLVRHDPSFAGSPGAPLSRPWAYGPASGLPRQAHPYT
jgi:hypothetical protein